MGAKEKDLIAENEVQPLSVTQALVGLGLEDSDTDLLRYFDFFSKQVPISAAYFVHVLPEFDLMTAMYEKATDLLSSNYAINEVVIEQMEQKINSMISKKDDFYIEYDIKEGNPLEKMLAIAEEMKVDLLVIGQSTEKSIHNILAKNLARKTEANVLIVPEKAKPGITNILVPIDFSPNSARSLKAAVAFCRQLEKPARITCLFVYSLPSIRHFRFDTPWIQMKNTVEDNIKDGFNAFIHTNAPGFKDQIDIALVEKSHPGIATFIVDYAHDNGCNFLFLGAKGHSNVHRLLMGSVTEELLDVNDDIPVMIIR